jgi:hypothetical protein
MRLAKDHDLIQALASQRADQTFGDIHFAMAKCPANADTLSHVRFAP